jgi:hypothetical protein
MTKLILAFHNFANAPTKRSLIILKMKNRNFVLPVLQKLEVINKIKEKFKDMMIKTLHTSF